MRRSLIFVCLLLFVAWSAGSAAAQPPRVSWAIQIIQGRTVDYQYTLTNTATQDDGTPTAISEFGIDAPRGVTVIGGGQYTPAWSFRQGGTSSVVTYRWQNLITPLMPGESVTFHIATGLAPTWYSWDGHGVNWGYNGVAGDSFVAVPGPVPEPSSVIAVLAGTGGFGLVMRRRRG